MTLLQDDPGLQNRKLQTDFLAPYEITNHISTVVRQNQGTLLNWTKALTCTRFLITLNQSSALLEFVSSGDTSFTICTESKENKGHLPCLPSENLSII